MNKILRWVKASERLPELVSVSKQYVMRFCKMPAELYLYNRYEIKRNLEAAYEVEWLEETEPQTNEGVIPYLRSEQEGQIIRMKALGIPIEGQTFEQCVNAAIFLAGGYKTAQTSEGVTEEMVIALMYDVWKVTEPGKYVPNMAKEIHQQFIEPLQKQVKELKQRNKLLEVPDQGI